MHLSSSDLIEQFPFHIVVAADGTIVQWGRSLPKVWPGVAKGLVFVDCFEVQRPKGLTGAYEDLRTATSAPMVVSPIGEDVAFRGGVIPKDDSVVLLLWPWIRSVDALGSLGLTWADFPAHDPLSEWLVMLQGRDASLGDAKRLASKLRRQKQDLQRAKAESEQASEAKGRFLANMSHEIRTPLNGVLGAVSLLGQTEPNPEQCELIGILDRSARHLLNVLNDILDLSKVEAGALTLEDQPYSVDELLGDVMQLFRSQADDAGLQFSGSRDEAVPARLQGDVFRLRQILCNLVANAIKFTESGSVAVTVTVARSEEDGQLLAEWSVVDTGCGMTESAVARILEPFVQADLSTTREFGGTGLGLSISHQLAELMGGELAVQSAEGRGTRVVVTLPIREPEKFVEASGSSETIAPSADSEEAVQGLKVLLVEDNLINRTVAVKMLRRLGHEVSVASDGVEGVEAFVQDRYDLVLMDYQMPRMDGVEASVAIREFEKNQGRDRTPILALTANAMAEDRRTCLDAGMDEHLVKPLTLEALRTALRAWAGGPASGS